MDSLIFGIYGATHSKNLTKVHVDHGREKGTAFVINSSRNKNKCGNLAIFGTLIEMPITAWIYVENDKRPFAFDNFNETY